MDFFFLRVQWKGTDCWLLSVFQVTNTFHHKGAFNYLTLESKLGVCCCPWFSLRVHMMMHKAQIAINHVCSGRAFTSRSIYRPMCTALFMLPSKKPYVTHPFWVPSLWTLPALILPTWCQRHGWAGRLCTSASSDHYCPRRGCCQGRRSAHLSLGAAPGLQPPCPEIAVWSKHQMSRSARIKLWKATCSKVMTQNSSKVAIKSKKVLAVKSL